MCIVFSIYRQDIDLFHLLLQIVNSYRYLMIIDTLNHITASPSMFRYARLLLCVNACLLYP